MTWGCPPCAPRGSQRSRYLHHGGELHGVAAAAGGEAHAGLAPAPGGVDGAVVAGAVAAPAPGAVVEPAPRVPAELEILGGERSWGGGRGSAGCPHACVTRSG